MEASTMLPFAFNCSILYFGSRRLPGLLSDLDERTMTDLDPRFVCVLNNRILTFFCVPKKTNIIGGKRMGSVVGSRFYCIVHTVD
jgi:hypothetical protein